MGLTEANYVAQRLHGKGNVLEIRGIAGTSVDNDIHAGIVQGFAKYPKIKVVARTGSSPPPSAKPAA